MLHNRILATCVNLDLHRMYLFDLVIDSWQSNSKILLKPTIKYQHYQFQCLLANQSILYDSSFNDQYQQSYLSTVSVGTDSTIYGLSVSVLASVKACTVLTYNKVMINDNYEVLVVIPFSFGDESSTASTISLSSVTQRGKLQIFSSGHLIDTTIPITQTSYTTMTAHGFSLIQNVINLSSKNLTVQVNVGTSKAEYGSGSTTEYNGMFEIEAEVFIKSESLLNNIRGFIPFYMFLLVPLLFFVVVPVLQWMFGAKLYYAKCDKGKIRLQ